MHIVYNVTHPAVPPKKNFTDFGIVWGWLEAMLVRSDLLSDLEKCDLNFSSYINCKQTWLCCANNVDWRSITPASCIDGTVHPVCWMSLDIHPVENHCLVFTVDGESKGIPSCDVSCVHMSTLGYWKYAFSFVKCPRVIIIKILHACFCNKSKYLCRFWAMHNESYINQPVHL